MALPNEKDSTQERETASGKDTNRKVQVDLPYIKVLSEVKKKEDTSVVIYQINCL